MFRWQCKHAQTSFCLFPSCHAVVSSTFIFSLCCSPNVLPLYFFLSCGLNSCSTLAPIAVVFVPSLQTIMVCFSSKYAMMDLDYTNFHTKFFTLIRNVCLLPYTVLNLFQLIWSAWSLLMKTKLVGDSVENSDSKSKTKVCVHNGGHIRVVVFPSFPNQEIFFLCLVLLALIFSLCFFFLIRLWF